MSKYIFRIENTVLATKVELSLFDMQHFSLALNSILLKNANACLLQLVSCFEIETLNIVGSWASHVIVHFLLIVKNNFAHCKKILNFQC